jgi:hypothetical protein
MTYVIFKYYLSKLNNRLENNIKTSISTKTEESLKENTRITNYIARVFA